MSMNYPMFTSNNESVILFPGSRFSKKELLSRLHEIDPNIDNTLDKNNLIKIYLLIGTNLKYLIDCKKIPNIKNQGWV